MKVNMTHNENIKIFSNISCHLELEDMRLKVVRPGAHVYVLSPVLRNSLASSESGVSPRK